MKVKLRHKIVFALLRPLFRVILFFKLGYRAKKFTKQMQAELGVKPPFFILGSHISGFDPFLLSLCVAGPIYFVATDDIFSRPFWSKVMKFLVSPIPKSKGMSDLQTVRDALEVSKQGGTVAVFPSGNTSYTGNEAYIAPQIARLAKLMGCDLLFFKTEGLFGADPRWGRNARKGKCYGKIEKVLPKAQLKAMSAQEVYQTILTVFAPQAAESGTKMLWKSTRRAEHLERFVYVCPMCGAFNSLASKGNNIACNRCELVLEYTQDLKLKPLRGNMPLLSLKQWNEYQIEQTKQLLEQTGVIFEDSGIKLLLNMRARIKAMLMRNATLQLFSHKLVVSDGAGNQKVFLFANIHSIAMQGKNKLIVYSKGESFQIRGKKTNNHYKYMVYFYLKKQQQGENIDGVLEL